MRDQKVIVVGAGLVGSLWGLALKKLGFEVDVYEKRSDLRNAQSNVHRSINLIITSRGLQALDEIGIIEKAVSICTPVFGRSIHAIDGSNYFQPYGKKEEFNLSVSRLELNKLLISEAENAGVQFNFDHTAESFDFSKNSIEFSCLKGRSKKVNYDFLFGTDGAGSAVRKSLTTSMPDIYQDTKSWLGLNYLELEMPSRPDGTYQINKNALHIWARGHHMMMALANRDGSFTVTLYMPPSGFAESFSELDSSEKIESYFKLNFPDAVSLMPNYISDFLERPSSPLGTTKLNNWIFRDNVCLMGDAAHPIVPFFGQGMNSGFEDVTELLNQFKTRNHFDLEAYFLGRKPNADAIADMAVENWHEMSKSVADPDFLFRKQIEVKLEENFPHLYKARYGMVTYTTLPFAAIREIGQIQFKLLNELKTNMISIEDLNLQLAKEKIEATLLPAYARWNINPKQDFQFRFSSLGQALN